MSSHSVRDELAMACRVMARHRLIDLWGHASIRVPKSSVILVTPRFGKSCLPRNIRSEQMLVTDLRGNIVEGSGELPLQFAADLELYRQAESAGACIFASPKTAMAASIADYDLRPLTHMEAEVGYGMRTWRSKSLVRESAPARDLAEFISQATCVNQPGIGTWTAGKDIVGALMNLFHLEYLAQANLIAAPLPSGLLCQKADSDKMWRQFAGWDHYVEFFHSLDPGPLPHPAAQSPSAKFEAHAIKEAVGLSCKALWERDTLVAFLEHVSHRLPQDNRLIISAAKNFGTIGPADMCVLDYNANWLDGPKPPGFKWFHAQIIEERPDVQAIVHTHDLYGRIYALSGQTLSPIFRVGLEVAMREMPIYPRCDLMVDADIRRKAVDLLDKGPIIHEACHGTDFVAPTLEEALVDSIQREAFLEMDHLARRFGEPKPMPTDLESVKFAEASAENWWWFYTAEIGAPRRSVAGL